jgi:hypothetical protein
LDVSPSNMVYYYVSDLFSLYCSIIMKGIRAGSSVFECFNRFAALPEV